MLYFIQDLVDILFCCCWLRCSRECRYFATTVCKFNKKKKNLLSLTLPYYHILSIFAQNEDFMILFCNPTTKRVKIQLFWFFSNEGSLVVFDSPIVLSDSNGLEHWFLLICCLQGQWLLWNGVMLIHQSFVHVLSWSLFRKASSPRKSISWNWDLLMIHFDRFNYC